MIQLEEFPCKNIFEAVLQERFWCEKLKATLNSNIPSRTKTEWNLENRQQILENQKEYRESHTEYNKEYKSNWYEKNKCEFKCECGIIISNKSNIKAHERTQKHLKFLEQNK